MPEPSASRAAPRPARPHRFGSTGRGLRRIGAAGGWWVLGAFAVSRVLVRVAGVRFDASSLPTAWQLVDPSLLRDHLIPSLWYSHSQPPLFNLFIGLVLDFSPLSDTRSFALLFLAMGVALSLTVLALCRSLGASRWVAIGATIVITCSPATLLYENWLFYTYPITLLVTGLVLAVARWAATGRSWWFVAVCVLAAATVLTQSIFHPVWYLVVIALAVLARRPRRLRLSAPAVLVPLLLIAGLVVKNQVLFDTPGLTSWAGFNLQRMTTEQLTPEQRDALVASGVLSPQAGLMAFLPYDAYAPVVPPCQPAHPDVGVLAEATKPSGAPNFNDECYLPLYRQAQTDGLAAARHAPHDVLKAQIASWQFSLRPASRYSFLNANRWQMTTYNDVFDRVVMLDVNAPTVVSSPPNVRALYTSPMELSLTVLAAFLLVIGLGVGDTIGWVRRRSATARQATQVTIAVTVVWVFVVGNALEIGENARIRWMVEPMMLAVLAVTGERVVRSLWHRRHTPPVGPESPSAAALSPGSPPA